MNEPIATSTPSVQHGAVFEPVTKGERISSVDVLRGVALLGILLMNIVAFGLPYAYDNPTNSGGAEGPNLVVWITNNMFFEGTMRAIFSMLFGAGVILLTSRAEARGAQAEIADIYYRRTLWLILFGLVHAYFFLWMGEILFYYGVMGLLIYPFRKLKPRSLMIIGLLLLASVVPQSIFGYVGMQEAELESREAQAARAAGETLDREQEQAIEDWEDTLERAKPPQWKIDEVVEGFQGGYVSVLGQVAPKVAKWQSGGIYFWSPFDILSMMLI